MNKVVLLADDEENILQLLSATLGSDDRYSLVLARDGEEALRCAQQERPDLAFLDVMMPKMDGFEVCRRLRSSDATAHVKVVLLTALAQDSDRQRADEVGADYYFTKPFSPGALQQKTDELLGLE